MDLLLNFYNYLENSLSILRNLEQEIIYLYHTPEGSQRHNSVKELLQSIIGELNVRFRNIESLPRSFFEYYLKGQNYFIYGSPIDKLMGQIDEVKNNLDKVNVERRSLDYNSKYNIYEFKESVKKLNSSLFILHQSLRESIIKNNELEDIVSVREFSQLNLSDDFRDKEVARGDKPSSGFGWKVENPSTGEWDWWKTNWDTSD